MHVLVVGGNGFIGSHLIDALLAENLQVTVLDRTAERFRQPLPDVTYVHGSFGDVKDVQRALRGRPDVIIHLGQYSLSLNSVGISESDLRNLRDSVKLFEACIKHGVAKIIFMSTGGKIYGITDHLPLKESDPTNPLGSYAITKLAIEKHLNSLSHYCGVEVVIVRPSNPYGVRQSPLGAQGVIPIFAWNILHKNPITIWGNGTAVRDYIDVRDVARFCCLAAMHSCKGIFNLGSGIGVNTIELVTSLTEILKIDPVLRWAPARELDVPAIVLDSNRAQQQFNWRPQTDMRASLEQVTEWLSNLANIEFTSPRVHAKTDSVVLTQIKGPTMECPLFLNQNIVEGSVPSR